MENRGIRAFLVSVRMEQWIKNLFVLAPLLFGGKLGELPAIWNAVCATGAFCLLSSALYLVNDVADADSDRAHPRKRLRPLASGALSVRCALLGVLFLAAAAFGLAVPIGSNLLAVLILYTALMAGYSFGLKRVMVLDGVVIACGFVLRVLGGAAAVRVEPSHWLVVCAFLLALYLAFTKRRQELLSLSGSAGRHRAVLAEYSVPYLDHVNSILLGATIVCYALYTVAPETIARFGTDRLLYGAVFVVYGLLRYMALAHHNAEGDNPGRLLLHDTPLLVSVIGWALYNALVIYGNRPG